MSRGFGEVQDALTGEASDIGLVAGHDLQTRSSPTTSIELTLSASPASATADHSVGA